MKFINKIFFLAFAGLLILSCQEDDLKFGDITAPTELVVNFTVQGQDAANPFGDGSGKVDFTASAQNAINFTYDFGDMRSGSAYDGTITHQFVEQGTNVYSVTVTATGTGGASTTQTVLVEVFSAFDDAEAKQFLTGGTTKTWYWAAAEAGHLGVGPNDPNIANPGENNFPAYYSASPFEKNGAGESMCLYMDQMVFTMNGNNVEYELLNGGETYFNASFEGVAGGANGFDYCYAYDTSGVKNVTFLPSDSIVPDTEKRGTTMQFSGDGFMSYYIDSSVYDILEISDNRLVVRSIMNGNLAWYHIFSTDDPNATGGGGPTGSLVWSDEFDVDGAPDATKWTYDLGTGSNGWGNGESQTYTDRVDNVKVENGLLKITAKAESLNGSNYTSARIKSEGLYEFTYGTVEIRAKLPTGVGTWPALWTLGADYLTNPWPAAGEMDIMEHVGRDQDNILGTVHHPGAFAGTADGGSLPVPGVSTDFHVYKLEWTATDIKFFVDDQQFHQVANNSSLPFDKDFFFIMNVAMGGTLGGTIDPAFVESTMEVDYIRVYQ
ncbi:MAG: family 16 glycosylhydrolase [Nonlabens sp.]|uniref:family 16 glycosylhydrolase n=1 Tax=Nonlabens sp. TaxID=1888209 RepID=UPI003EF5CFD4